MPEINTFAEKLNAKDISAEEIQGIWRSRRGRMALRRQYFEPLWRNGIGQFFQGITSEQSVGSRPLYSNLYEMYDFSLFSRDGLRFRNIKYPLVHAITMRSLAYELKNLPKVNFMAVGSNDQSKPIVFKNLFYQVLYDMDNVEEDFETLLDTHIYGSAVTMQLTEDYCFSVENAEWNDKTKKFDYTPTEKNYRQVGYKRMDLRHVYLDEHCRKSNLSDLNYAQVDEYMSKEEFLMRFSNEKYDQTKVIEASIVESPIDDTGVYKSWFDSQGVNFVKVSHSWDKIFDRYHILANGVLINDKNNPIPRKCGRRGKDIPISLAIQYKIPGAPYGYGNPHVVTSFNHIKNLVRLMILEITQKSAKPMVAIDPMSNFDEQNFEWGTDFIRVKPEDLKVIPITPDLNALYKLDEITDADVIRVTGININDTSSADAGETARKTIIRRESQVSIIELKLSFMTDTYFKRLYTLLKDDIQLHYQKMLDEGEEINIRTKDVKLVRGKKKSVIEHKRKGFNAFKVEAEDIDLELDIDLQLGSLAMSKELDKAQSAEMMEIAAKLPNGFDMNALTAWVVEKYGLPEDVLIGGGKTPDQNAKPEDLARGAINDPSLLPAEEQLKMGMSPEQEQQNPITAQNAIQQMPGEQQGMPAGQPMPPTAQ